MRDPRREPEFTEAQLEALRELARRELAEIARKRPDAIDGTALEEQVGDQAP